MDTRSSSLSHFLADISESRNGFAGYHLVCTLFEKPQEKIQMGPGEYFLMGDTNMDCMDSRNYGPVNRASIIAKAWYIYSPADRKGKVK